MRTLLLSAGLVTGAAAVACLIGPVGTMAGVCDGLHSRNKRPQCPPYWNCEFGYFPTTWQSWPGDVRSQPMPPHYPTPALPPAPTMTPPPAPAMSTSALGHRFSREAIPAMRTQDSHGLSADERELMRDRLEMNSWNPRPTAEFTGSIHDSLGDDLDELPIMPRTRSTDTEREVPYDNTAQVVAEDDFRPSASVVQHAAMPRVPTDLAGPSVPWIPTAEFARETNSYRAATVESMPSSAAMNYRESVSPQRSAARSQMPYEGSVSYRSQAVLPAAAIPQASYRTLPASVIEPHAAGSAAPSYRSAATIAVPAASGQGNYRSTPIR